MNRYINKIELDGFKYIFIINKINKIIINQDVILWIVVRLFLMGSRMRE